MTVRKRANATFGEPPTVAAVRKYADIAVPLESVDPHRSFSEVELFLMERMRPFDIDASLLGEDQDHYAIRAAYAAGTPATSLFFGDNEKVPVGYYDRHIGRYFIANVQYRPVRVPILCSRRCGLLGDLVRSLTSEFLLGMRDPVYVMSRGCVGAHSRLDADGTIHKYKVALAIVLVPVL